MKELLFMLFLVMNGPSSSAQSDSLKQVAKTDSLYLAEMMSRRETDKSTGETKIDCPILGNPLCATHIAKYINKGKSSFYLTLILRDTACQTNSKGAKILFTDGTEMNKPEQKIATEISDISNIYDDFRRNYKCQYLANFMLTPSELKILGSKTIRKFTLINLDAVPNTKNSEDFRIYCRNIILTK